jgi:phospholipase C
MVVWRALPMAHIPCAPTLSGRTTPSINSMAAAVVADIEAAFIAARMPSGGTPARVQHPRVRSTRRLRNQRLRSCTRGFVHQDARTLYIVSTHAWHQPQEHASHRTGGPEPSRTLADAKPLQAFRMAAGGRLQPGIIQTHRATAPSCSF